MLGSVGSSPFPFEELEKQCPLRRDAVEIVPGAVRIRTDYHDDPAVQGHIYSFQLERINTPLKLLVWVHHLNEKTWFEYWMTRELIAKISEHFGWKLPWSC